jgi:hypothetical protein
VIVILDEVLPEEMARVRDDVMPAYLEIGPAGALALDFLYADLDRATQALATGDIMEMMRAYETLKRYHT